MLPVVRLQAKVAQTRSIEKGAGVGYGHTYHAQGPLRLATISFGYADGWQRRAASKRAPASAMATAITRKVR